MFFPARLGGCFAQKYARPSLLSPGQIASLMVSLPVRAAGHPFIERCRVVRAKRRGFTLVELLVVVTIIGILIALLMPAVQAARESGRRARCANNLKQIGLAFLQHLEKHGRYPTGGWGVRWVGDADRGFTRRQPGGWVYNILPFMEQPALWEQPADGQPDVLTSTQKDGARDMVRTPLELMNCPSRRRAILYPDAGYLWAHNMSSTDKGARTDYCGSAGTRALCTGTGNINSLARGDEFRDSDWIGRSDGITYQWSEVESAQVTDGESNTYMVGEKYLSPDRYLNGVDSSDNESMYVGDDRDTLCNSSYRPLQDTPSVFNQFCFGSPHPAGWNVCLCDGSVRLMNFTINPTTHLHLGDRNDGQPIDITTF